MMLLDAQKTEIRKRALARRRDLSVIERTTFSNQLLTFVDQLQIPDGALVAGFLPIREEVDLQPLLTGLHETGKHLALPAVISKTEIEFRRWKPGDALAEAGFGTLAPGKEAQIIAPDFLFVPLSAYDETGGRMGYGAGYYDRAIAKLKQIKAITSVGVAFSIQCVDKVPMGPYDQHLDGIFTEKGYLKFSK